MVECHGSQCGFCTPGFVMSLVVGLRAPQARAARGRRASSWPTSSSGNLCRCTGYRPILDAGERMFDLPAGAARRGAGGRRAARAARDGALDYAAPRAERRRPLPRADARWTELAALRAAHPRRASARRLDRHRPVGQQAVPRPAATCIYVGEVDELKRIEERDGVLHDRRRRVARRRLARAGAARWPALTDVWLRFAVAADPPRRHDGRQRRQRLADRRLARRC